MYGLYLPTQVQLELTEGEAHLEFNKLACETSKLIMKR